ncbi:hypothetical protein HOF65_00160 [bacterium]|nr:hypothetical protein [bacterium]MBT3852463.1 hypothetical protein [bacterium]MBT6778884.1 hypothetical protein [bacterium]
MIFDFNLSKKVFFFSFSSSSSFLGSRFAVSHIRFIASSFALFFTFSALSSLTLSIFFNIFFFCLL